MDGKVRFLGATFLVIMMMGFVQTPAAVNANINSSIGATTSPPPVGSQHLVPGEIVPLTGPFDWAIGAYSTNTGKSTETTVWTNLPSSFALTGVNFAEMMVNAPFSATGTITYGGHTWTIDGIILQGINVYYNGQSNPYPDADIVFLATYSGTNKAFQYIADWAYSSGSGSINETIKYQTYSSTTGWWFVFTTGGSSPYTYDFLAVTGSGITTNWSPANTEEIPSGFTYSISSIGTTSTDLYLGGYYYYPSIALEVNETSSGNFFSDNTNAAIEANVGTSKFYYYANSTTNDFHVGLDNPPSSYGSGLTYEIANPPNNVFKYYDQFGTGSGINSWMSSNWGISGAAKTHTQGSELITLNFACTGSNCPIHPTTTSPLYMPSGPNSGLLYRKSF